MNILLTNDDGISSPGINYLADELRKKHRVIIVAPDKQRSACSHQISIHSPVRFTKVKEDVYFSDGYPADCIKFALKGLLDEKIDFVASGINEGPNMGIDVFYSGTVAGAREGLINKIPSCAFSSCAYNDKEKMKLASIHSARLVDLLYEKHFTDNVFFNINFPKIDNYKGYRITKLGNRVFKEIVLKRFDPMGREYYWLGGEMPDFHLEPETDFSAIEDGYVSISPLYLDVTNIDVFNQLRGAFD